MQSATRGYRSAARGMSRDGSRSLVNHPFDPINVHILMSAKGTVRSQPGESPQECSQFKSKGLKARTINLNNGSDESDFQSSPDLGFTFLGRCPRLGWITPLAFLKPCHRRRSAITLSAPIAASVVGSGMAIVSITINDRSKAGLPAMVI